MRLPLGGIRKQPMFELLRCTSSSRKKHYSSITPGFVELHAVIAMQNLKFRDFVVYGLDCRRHSWAFIQKFVEIVYPRGKVRWILGWFIKCWVECWGKSKLWDSNVVLERSEGNAGTLQNWRNLLWPEKIAIQFTVDGILLGLLRKSYGESCEISKDICTGDELLYDFENNRRELK